MHQKSKKRLRIWIINQYGSIPQTGYGNRTWQLAKHLAELSNSVTLFLPSYNHVYKSKNKRFFGMQELSKDARVFWVPSLKYKNSLGGVRAAGWLVFSLLLFPVLLLARPKPEIILHSSPSLFAAMPCLSLAKILKIPMIFEVRDIWPSSLSLRRNNGQKDGLVFRFLKVIERLALRYSDLIISPLPGLQEYLDEEGIKTHFLWVPQCAESVETKKPKKEKIAGQLNVVYAGSINLSNDLDTLFDAASLLKNHKLINIRVIGDGPMIKHYRERQIEESLHNVEILSAVPSNELKTIYDYSHVGFHGAYDKVFYKYGIAPIKVPEYLENYLFVMQCYSGAHDMLSKFNFGKVLPAGDGVALAEALLEVSKMSDEAFSEMSDKAIDEYKLKFSYQAVVRKLYDRIVNLNEEKVSKVGK